MSHFNEAQLEASIIQLFLEQGYTYFPGDTITRADDDVLIREGIRSYLAARYKSDGITEDEINRAIRIMEQQEGGTVYDENRAFIELLMNGFSLKRTDMELFKCLIAETQ